MDSRADESPVQLVISSRCLDINISILIERETPWGWPVNQSTMKPQSPVKVPTRFASFPDTPPPSGFRHAAQSRQTDHPRQDYRHYRCIHASKGIRDLSSVPDIRQCLRSHELGLRKRWSWVLEPAHSSCEDNQFAHIYVAWKTTWQVSNASGIAYTDIPIERLSVKEALIHGPRNNALYI